MIQFKLVLWSSQSIWNLHFWWGHFGPLLWIFEELCKRLSLLSMQNSQCPIHIQDESHQNVWGWMQGRLLFCKTRWVGKTENVCSKVARNFFVLLLLQLQTHSSMGHPNPLTLRDKRTSSFFTPEITLLPFCPRQSPYGKKALDQQMWSF